MSVRLKIILLFGGLAALLLASEWFLVHALTRDLTGEIGEVAVSVGRDVLSGVVETRVIEVQDDGSGEEGSRVITLGEHWTSDEMAAVEDPDGRDVVHDREDADVQVHVLHGEEVVFVPPQGAAGEYRLEITGAGESDRRAASGEALAARAGPRRMIRRVVHSETAGGGGTTGFGYATVTDERFCAEDDDECVQAVGTAFNLALDRPGDAHFMFMTGPDARTTRIPIPRLGVQDAIDRAVNRLLLGSLGILSVGLLVAGFIAHRVSAPLRGLALAARSVGEGQLGAQAPVRGGGEVGEAIRSFNTMSARLRELDAAERDLRTREHLSEIGEIARGLAHTLRNPLNALGLTVTEMAARAPVGDDTDALVDGAQRQIRRMDGSIRSFLALASGGAGEVESVDVVALAKDVVLEVLQDSRQRTPIKLDVPDVSVSVRGIAPELRAVFQALLVNAVEASPGGSAVRVRVTRNGDRARLEFEDAGAGVPVEVRARLFTPHTTTKATGSGMGLYLAHRIATSRYGGQLDLRDREPQGSIAVLELGDRQESPRG